MIIEAIKPQYLFSPFHPPAKAGTQTLPLISYSRAETRLTRDEFLLKSWGWQEQLASQTNWCWCTRCGCYVNLQTEDLEYLEPPATTAFLLPLMCLLAQNTACPREGEAIVSIPYKNVFSDRDATQFKPERDSQRSKRDLTQFRVSLQEPVSWPRYSNSKKGS